MTPHKTQKVSYYCLRFTDNEIEIQKYQSDHAGK